MKIRYPASTLPRAQAVTDLIMTPAPPLERLDPDLRRVLASRLAALAPARHLGAVRLDSYTVIHAHDPVTGPPVSFSWSPQTTKRILGLASAQRVVAGMSANPTSAVRAEIADVVARAHDHPTRPGALGSWLCEAPFGVLGAVTSEAVAYATDLLFSCAWDRLGDDAFVGRADPVWAVPGAPWVALRGRRDATILLDAEEQTRAIVALRAGRPTASSVTDLSHVALVEGMTHPDLPLPTRVVGIWPATGKTICLEVSKEATQRAARSVVDALQTMRKQGARRHAA